MKEFKHIRKALDKVRGTDAFRTIAERCANRTAPICAGQLFGSSKALLVAHLAQSIDRPILFITAEQSEIYHQLDDLNFFLQASDPPVEVLVYPHPEVLPYEAEVPELTVRLERMLVLRHAWEEWWQPNASKPPTVVITCVAALLKRGLHPSHFPEHALEFRIDETVDRDAAAHWLVEQGYEFRELVSRRGDFSVRGGILDIYPLSYPHPVRIEFLGDEIDSIRTFDVSTQRSVSRIKEVSLLPSNEDFLIARALEENGAALTNYLTHLLPDPLIVLDEPEQIENEAESYSVLVQRGYRDAVEGHEQEEVVLGEEQRHHRERLFLRPPEDLYFSPESFSAKCFDLGFVSLTEFALPPETGHINCGTQSPQFAADESSERLRQLVNGTAEGRKTFVVCDNTGQETRFKELAASAAQHLHLPDDAGKPATFVGNLCHGFIIPDLRLDMITDREVFGRYRRFRTPTREGIALPVLDLVDLTPGDFVVHIDHGIGKFRTLKTIATDGRSGEYLELEYANRDVLYVPLDQIDRVGRYIGSDTNPPVLAHLGTKTWENSKARARQAVEDMAQDLLEIYATREIKKGHAFSKDTSWQHEFESAFLYEETPDQWRSIEEVKQDMETNSPMDRLICGDVGFGKTEVAIRAAFKAVMDGKQVAVLVPTTILAQQHFNTFSERLADYPITTEMLSRFRTPAAQKKILADLKENKVDVIIGTHRLLSKDVELADLGLVIIDEEQRFGVRHKERLRQIRMLVDTLALSATPIPRTLYLSMSGIRDMSVVNTPPKNRLPIETYVMEWSKDVIQQSILREMARDGQVYLVHNRVESIVSMASLVQRIVPEARVAIGHGQMSERELEGVMMRFVRGEYDVLVATTIIENGLDIPNVNTIIVNRADHFGLAQLYQLRGRVGRDRHRAYCYLLVPSKRTLTSIARRRLLAIQEHNELGAGYQIALRDMEIRGIGNILGRQQHGHIAAIGFDLYTKLLGDTVARLRGRKKVDEVWETSLEMAPRGIIPPQYVESSQQRMAIHQRALKIKNPEQIDDFEEELTDIYGRPPRDVERLVLGLRLRVAGHAAGFEVVNVGKNRGHLIYHSSQVKRFDPLRVMQLDGKNGLKLTISTKDQSVIIDVQDREGENILAEKMVTLIAELQLPPTDEPIPQQIPPEPKPVKKKTRHYKDKKR
ncbi:MAG: transcription-repair coupling factor [bacterium]